MSKKWLALAAIALALVLAAGTFDSAEARKGGGFRGGGGGGHFGGRSFGGSRFVGRSFAGPRFRTFGGSRFVGRPRFYHGGHFRRRHFAHRHRHHHRHRHFRRHIFIGAPLFYGGYYYGYGSCRWLRYRALETGSPYWWARYHDCVNGYY